MSTHAPPPGGGPPLPSNPATGTSAPAPAQSYSDRLKVNVSRSERLKRKVLEINLDVDEGIKLKLEPSDVHKTLARIGIDSQSHMEGCQICPGNSRKISVWLKDGCDIGRFCKDESYKVADGVKTGLIKPADKSEVTVLVKNLGFNTPDSLVLDYLSKHGKVMSEKVIYDKEKEGPFKGLFNGNRKYLVDFSKGINAGSYHLLDGAKILISYSGQQKTCGRCHQVSNKCPGGGFAQTCEAKNGKRVTLIDHMKAHWAAIGFKPSEFQLKLNEEDENINDTADAVIKTNNTFTPPPKETMEAEASATGATQTIAGVVIKSLPESLPEKDIIQFLKSKGLENKGQLKIHHNKKNTNVDIEDIGDVTANTLIKNIHEKVFFNKKVYCRAFLHVHTPTKPPATQEKDSLNKNDQVSENTGSPLLKPNIPPGLPEEEVKKAARKAAREKRKKDKMLKKESAKENQMEETEDLVKEDFLKDPSHAEFEFGDIDDDSSSDEETAGFAWSKSPLESEDPEKVKLLNKLSFSSLSAKQIQKEHFWLSAANKRALTSPTWPSGRRMRSRSACLIDNLET